MSHPVQTTMVHLSRNKWQEVRGNSVPMAPHTFEPPETLSAVGFDFGILKH
jgi:hypothetical protein